MSKDDLETQRQKSYVEKPHFEWGEMNFDQEHIDWGFVYKNIKSNMPEWTLMLQKEWLMNVIENGLLR